jgi:hypothetical protein
MVPSDEVTVVHPRLGALRRHGQLELLGSINVDPRVRVPRRNGATDAEILLEVNAFDTGPDLDAHLDRCADRLTLALATLPAIRRYAIDHAPQNWVAYYSAQPGRSLIDRLFLDGLEVDRQLRVTVVFDFGDLDSLVVVLDDRGSGSEVFLRA